MACLVEGDVHVLQIDLERDSSDGPYTLTISVTAAVSIDVERLIRVACTGSNVLLLMGFSFTLQNKILLPKVSISLFS